MICNLKLPTPQKELIANPNKALTYKCKFAVKPRLMFYGEGIPESVKQGLDKITDSNWKPPNKTINEGGEFDKQSRKFNAHAFENFEQKGLKGGGCDLLLCVG